MTVACLSVQTERKSAFIFYCFSAVQSLRS